MTPKKYKQQGAKRSSEDLGDTTHGIEAITYRKGIRKTTEIVAIVVMLIERAAP